MYTVDEDKENLYEEDDYGNSSWNNSKGLIFKIIIIILCIIVLIWLIKALKNNRTLNSNAEEVHTANVEKVRLAAEKYFFINGNKEKYSYVSLAGLKDNGLIDDVVDAKEKVCNEHSSKVDLKDDVDSYKMIVSLSCSTNDKDEVFYYHKNTLACLNCNGKTNMTGKEVVVAKADENDGGKGNDSNNVSNDTNKYNDYSCAYWTDWSKTRVYESDLVERTKTLVQGVKYGTKKTYSDWSEYTTTPIVGSDTIEVETKTVSETAWSENKTGTNIDTNNSNIRVISTETAYDSNYNCENGYVENNTCYSKKTVVGNLTFKEYNSGKYKVKKDYCEGVRTLKDSDGLYVLTYVNCEYNEILGKANKGSSYTIYTYQELETKDVTYYRYRTVTEVSEPDQYTSTKYEEKDLPAGYVKVAGSEETYYSYRLRECLK